MKFCRFELASAPGQPRTGIAYEGRIYETDGTNAIGIHEASDIRLLAPIGRPTSVRVFRPGDHAFDYANPMAMHGPNEPIPVPIGADRVGYVPSLAVVVGGAGASVEPSVADDLVLGLALGHLLSTLRVSGGAALDVGFAIGPALITPDEFSSDSVRPESGVRYDDTVTLTINGVEVSSFSVAALKPTVASAVSRASQSHPLYEGDLLLIPLGEVDLTPEPEDVLKLSGEKLGALTSRLVRA